MPEKSCCRPTFQSQRVHGYWTLLKSPWQQFYPKFPLIQDRLSSKRSLLVRCKILGLFGNTLTVDHMDSPHYSREISGTCSNAIIYKARNIFWNFYCIFRISRNVCACWKEKSTSWLKYFGNDRLRRMWLLECPKALLFEHPSRVNVFTGINNCWIHHGNTFILIFH